MWLELGQTFSLTHLAPFVDVSRKKIRKDVTEELKNVSDVTEELIEKITEKRVREEITRGVQMIQYQILTLLTTNGQTPFVSVFMYLNEAKDERTKADLALIIEEVLKEEDNIKEGSKYWYLTELAAKCSAKRLVPDYISEKKMLEYKIDEKGNGNCYACMGCRSFLTPYIDKVIIDSDEEFVLCDS